MTPEDRTSLTFHGLLEESRLAIQHFLESQELRTGGILIVRGATKRRTVPEVTYASDRHAEMLRSLTGTT